MVDILRTATSGLMAFRAALATTGHNIANVNTAYYSRQRVELSAPMPEGQGYGYLGRGVDIDSVARIYNGFVMQQLRGHQSGVSQYDTMNTLTGQMSALLGDTDVGLTPDLEAFFGSLQDLANSPTSITARQVFLDEGQTLTNRIQDIDAALSSLRESVDVGIRNAVTAINDLSAGLAKINQDISLASQSLTNAPNDLLDQRDKILVDLADLVGIQVVAQDGDGVSVFMSNGLPLVVGNNALKLEAVQSGFDPQEITVRLEGQAEGSDLEASLTTGQLGGYFEFRRTILNPAQDALGLLAIGVAKTFNEQHKKGMDLNGDLGGNLFTVGSPKVLPFTANSNATFTAAVTTDSITPITDAKAAAGATRLMRSDYDISYDGANYTAIRIADQKTILTSGDLAALNTELNKDGLNLTLTSGTPAAGDRFLLRPTRQASAGFDLAITDPRKVAAASPITTSATATNLGSASISAGTVLDATNLNLQNTVAIQFTSATTFDVLDVTAATTLVTGAVYDSTVGATVSQNGWSITLSGEPQTNDAFTVKNNIGGIGDNRNALELVKLQTKQQLMGGNDYRGVYAQMIAEVGAQGRRVENTLQSQEALLSQSELSRESVSGVSLDEEAADLLRFQQSYQAAAQVIQTANSLFDSLLDAVGS
ncbi:MAG: flagellar hook-associated protein FlgK [Synechococcaceae cyanobacterium SM1_2_3]|nr:flagellar hook-associated protein FlgK [Synechococcaceae cyanobacterium SM1_2_3]